MGPSCLDLGLLDLGEPRLVGRCVWASSNMRQIVSTSNRIVRRQTFRRPHGLFQTHIKRFPDSWGHWRQLVGLASTEGPNPRALWITSRLQSGIFPPAAFASRNSVSSSQCNCSTLHKVDVCRYCLAYMCFGRGILYERRFAEGPIPVKLGSELAPARCGY